MNSEAQDNAKAGAGAKAAWLLLTAAAILAAASIAYNVTRAPPDAQSAALQDETPLSIAQLQDAAQAAPQDAKVWQRLAAEHFNRGEFAEASSAYEKVVAITPEDAAMWSALGESRTYANDASAPDADPLPASALEAFEKAYQLDPKDPVARYFLAIKKDLAGDHGGAIDDWLALLKDTPPGAVWETNLIRTIEQSGAKHQIAVGPRLDAALAARAPALASSAVSNAASQPSVRGPSAQQIAEAQQMSSSDRDAMVAGMVSSLEARLQDEPQNLDGWVMLIRSRATLGETGKAREALANAIAANPGEADELRRQAAMLGIE